MEKAVTARPRVITSPTVSLKEGGPFPLCFPLLCAPIARVADDGMAAFGPPPDIEMAEDIPPFPGIPLAEGEEPEDAEGETEEAEEEEEEEEEEEDVEQLLVVGSSCAENKLVLLNMSGCNQRSEHSKRTTLVIPNGHTTKSMMEHLKMFVLLDHQSKLCDSNLPCTFIIVVEGQE